MNLQSERPPNKMKISKNSRSPVMTETVWRKAILSSGANIDQVIKTLDQTAIKIVMIVGEQGDLLGTISDGDIRRGLLRGLNLSSSIESVINCSPLVAVPNMPRELVLQMMIVNKVQQVPVLDEKRRVVGLHLWHGINSEPFRKNPMVIMAGGAGTRLRPQTEHCPKPMLRVSGKPILEHIVERAKLNGFDHFIFVIHYLGDMIEEYFGNGSRWQIKIDYIREEVPLGTAGGISLLRPRPDIPFVVTNGDIITDVDYGRVLDFHVRQEAVATMAVRLHEWQHPFGVVEIDGVDIIGFEEKPLMHTHINAGVYVLDPSVLDELIANEQCDMPTFFGRIQDKYLRTVAYPMHEPWLDLGRPSDFENADSIVSSLGSES